MVAVVHWAVEALNLVMLDSAGRCRFGGHSWRVSGAQFFAAMGVDMAAIKALGRWGSNAVEGYIADAATFATPSLAPALGSRIRSAVESGLTASASR
eukprot:4134561-Amphidinium_carterae.1